MSALHVQWKECNMATFYHNLSQCKGKLEFEGGNGFGTFYRCESCRKRFVLPTKTQVRVRPHLMEDFKKEHIAIRGTYP